MDNISMSITKAIYRDQRPAYKQTQPGDIQHVKHCLVDMVDYLVNTLNSLREDLLVTQRLKEQKGLI